MKKLTFKQLIEIEYVLIFDLIDQPLFFVGESDNKAYLFYFVDENSYLFSPLLYSDFKLLLGEDVDREVLNKLYLSNRLNIMKIQEDESVIYEEVENIKELNSYLPHEKFRRNIDIIRDVPLSEIDLKEFNRFDETLSNEIVVSMHDEKNSNVLSLNIFDSLIELVKKYREELNNEYLTDIPLRVIAPEFGSFRIGFKFDTNENKSLFDNEDNVDFTLLIDLINNLNADDISTDIIENRLVQKILPSLNKYYRSLDKENVYTILKTNTFEAKITNKLPNFEKNLDVLLEKKSKEITDKSYIYVYGDILSANTVNNHFILSESESGFIYRGKFESNLFYDLKSKNRDFKNFPSEIRAHIEKIITYEEGLPRDQIESLKPKYIMMDFEDQF